MKEKEGTPVGIVMLDTHFPRIAGDIGNPETFDFPVLYRIVPADAGAVVRHLETQDVGVYIRVAKELEEAGAKAVFTSCGFLGAFQKTIGEALQVPFVASNLMCLPFVERLLPAGKKAGVMTVNSETLKEESFTAVGAVRPDIVYGLQTGTEFTNAILSDRPVMDSAACEREHVRVARQMLQDHPEVGAIVLECTNMPPYAAAIRRAVKVPVFDICSLVRYLHACL